MHKLLILYRNTLSFLICFLLFAGCSASIAHDEVRVIEITDSEYEPMSDYIKRLQVAFSESPRVAQSGKPVDELFPAKEIPEDKLSWFLESYEDVTVEGIKGIRFNNSDILIVFFYSAEVPDETVSEHITININMYGHPLIPPPNVYKYSGRSEVGDGFGVIAYSFSGSEMDSIILGIAFDAREEIRDGL